ncbi:MAG: CCA tRNA nucleotidyltransferase [Gemmatimonadaceae bacterium]|nr:CCA tRNA nucleotidyltransferase [Gemmatimonadaceae bacterium]
MGEALIRPPSAVRDIAARLEGAGFETWCVGGAVRDALLGRADLDWDLATAALPGDVKRLFPRTVPVGIEHGTIGVFGSDGRLHEVTTFRADVETDGRHAVVRFGVSLEEDLARRDFTINAIAWSPARGELRDPFGGRADLQAGLVRAVGMPGDRMAEDRLRALRAIRFASRFGFAIDADTWAAIVASAPALGRLSVERVLQEWTKTLEQVRCPSVAFERWRAAGALRALVPALHDVDVRYFRAVDAVPLPATSAREERASLRRLVRLAVPFMALGGTGAQRALVALRASNQAVAFAGAVAAAWESFGPALAAHASSGNGVDAALRRTVSKIGRMRVAGTLRALAAVWAAGRAAGDPAPAPMAVRRLARQMLRVAFRDPVAISDLAVTGTDLQEAGIGAGPRMGTILHGLLDLVLDDPALNTHGHLLAHARRMAGEG